LKNSAGKQWIADEFSGMNLGDERLNERARILMERMSAKPTASIPMACSGWSETMAAYRFLANDELEWADILAPHWAQTQRRMSAHPVEWRLLSNRAAPALADVVELIDWYRARWEIELFFHVIKNGCRVEALQLSGIDRIERALALFMVVAWRIAHLMRTGRTCPDLDATLFFDPDEIQGAYLLTKKKPPNRPPRLNEVLCLIATLGGFLARKGDGEPGVKTIWLGLQRVMDAATTIQVLRNPEAMGYV
jgi:hypothetical protein